MAIPKKIQNRAMKVLGEYIPSARFENNKKTLPSLSLMFEDGGIVVPILGDTEEALVSSVLEALSSISVDEQVLCGFSGRPCLVRLSPADDIDAAYARCSNAFAKLFGVGICLFLAFGLRNCSVGDFSLSFNPADKKAGQPGDFSISFPASSGFAYNVRLTGNDYGQLLASALDARDHFSERIFLDKVLENLSSNEARAILQFGVLRIRECSRLISLFLSETVSAIGIAMKTTGALKPKK